MKKALWMMLAIVCMSFTDEDGSETVQLIHSSKLAIIEVKLNKRKAYFVVDSGASFSVVDKEQQKKFNFFINYAEQQEATGYGGSEFVAEATGITLSIGKKQLQTNWLTKDLTPIVNIIEKNDNVTISGIIGNDVLRNHNFVIDYKNYVVHID